MRVYVTGLVLLTALAATSGCKQEKSSVPARDASAASSGIASGPGIPPPPAAGAAAPPPPAAAADAAAPAAPAEATEAGTSLDKSMARLKRIGEAMLKYHAEHHTLPPAAVYNAQGRALLSWRVLLLPYLGEKDLAAQFHLDEAWDSDHNRELLGRIPVVYGQPDGGVPGKTQYLVPVGMGTLFEGTEGKQLGSILDGPENTLMVVEVDPTAAVNWTQPEDLRIIPAQPSANLGGARDGTFLAVCADGATHRLPVADTAVLKALMTMSGNEKVPLPTQPSKPDPTGRPAEPVKPKDPVAELLDKARQSLTAGRGQEGAAQLMAAAVARPDDGLLGTLRWAPAQKRPALLLRWGVAVTSSNAGGSRRGERDHKPGAAAAGQDANAAAQTWMAPVIQPAVGHLCDRIGEGEYGEWFKPDMWRQDAAGAPAANAPAGQAPAALGGPTSTPTLPAQAGPVGPGVFFLGQVELPAALDQAAKDGLDVLLVAAAGMKPVVRGQPQSVLVLSVYDAATRKQLWESRQINELRLKAAQASKSTDDKKKSSRLSVEDPAAETIESFLRFIDQHVKLAEMPAIGAEPAAKRAAALASAKHNDPLPALVELRYYEWKGLLKPAELSRHYAAILGAESGPLAAAGTEAQRCEALEKLIPHEPAVRR